MQIFLSVDRLSTNLSLHLSDLPIYLSTYLYIDMCVCVSCLRMYAGMHACMHARMDQAQQVGKTAGGETLNPGTLRGGVVMDAEASCLLRT